MTLLIDCGNTRCKLSRLLADGLLAPVAAIALDATDFASQLNAQLTFETENKRCYFASVANAQINSLIESVLSSAGFAVTRATTQAEAFGVRIAYPIPQQLGVDRFLALLAVHQTKKSALIVSVGSALTVDVLQADGHHHGGMITATEVIIHNAMESRFANFRNLSGAIVGLSDNTADALASGARYMVLGLIEKTWHEACLLLNEPDLPIVITGGDAEALLRYLPDNTSYRSMLVLEGLALLAGHLEKE